MGVGGQIRYPASVEPIFTKALWYEFLYEMPKQRQNKKAGFRPAFSGATLQIKV